MEGTPGSLDGTRLRAFRGERPAGVRQRKKELTEGPETSDGPTTAPVASPRSRRPGTVLPPSERPLCSGVGHDGGVTDDVGLVYGVTTLHEYLGTPSTPDPTVRLGSQIGSSEKSTLFVQSHL